MDGLGGNSCVWKRGNYRLTTSTNFGLKDIEQPANQTLRTLGAPPTRTLNIQPCGHLVFPTYYYACVLLHVQRVCKRLFA